MRFRNYFHETPSKQVQEFIRRAVRDGLKIDVWNDFVDSGLEDITEDDFSIVPRVLPASYLATIRRSSYLIAQFALRLISLPEAEVRAIIPAGPIRDHLLDELKVLKYRRGRITGSFRYDMAIVGQPHSLNPPQLLEINEIGFDGLARSSYFQKVLLQHLPELRPRLRSLDTAAAEVRNMQRLGPTTARFQYDSYNWDEEYLLRTSQRLGADIRLISPQQFKTAIDQSLLSQQPVSLHRGRLRVGKRWFPDAVNISYAFELKDYQEAHGLFSAMVRSRTPQYGPFLTGLIAAKTILVLLDDRALRRRLLGSAKKLEKEILPAVQLSDPRASDLLRKPQDWVLKHTDGCGGELVFMDQDMIRRLRRIRQSRRYEWILQQKTKLNLIDLDGILSRPREGISDLGVFVQYDWSGDRFSHFEIGGLMSRATDKSLKVNVSGGGCQVAVLLDRKA